MHYRRFFGLLLEPRRASGRGLALLFEMTREVLFSHRWKIRPALRFRLNDGIVDDDVGRNPGRLDRSAVRGVVARRGQADGGGVVQWQDGLHRTLAEGLGAEH